MNRRLIHGAYTLDDEGSRILFRDTLQLETLDLGELGASIEALSLGLAENAHQFIKMAEA